MTGVLSGGPFSRRSRATVSPRSEPYRISWRLPELQSAGPPRPCPPGYLPAYLLQTIASEFFPFSGAIGGLIREMTSNSEVYYNVDPGVLRLFDRDPPQPLLVGMRRVTKKLPPAEHYQIPACTFLRFLAILTLLLIGVGVFLTSGIRPLPGTSPTPAPITPMAGAEQIALAWPTGFWPRSSGYSQTALRLSSSPEIRLPAWTAAGLVGCRSPCSAFTADRVACYPRSPALFMRCSLPSFLR